MTKAQVKEVWTNTVRSQAGTREFALCTAWVNFDGTGTVAIRDSLNVSSITDNGTGQYTANFAQNMDNTNFSSPCSVTTSTALNNRTGATHSPSLGSISIRTVDIAGQTDQDVDFIFIAVFGGITL